MNKFTRRIVAAVLGVVVLLGFVAIAENSRDFSGTLVLLLNLAIIPFLSFLFRWQFIRATLRPVPKWRSNLGSIGTAAINGGMAVVAAHTHRITLLSRSANVLWALLLGTGVVVAMAVGFWRWIRISSPVEKDLWQKMLPSDSREFPLWIAVSATAGIFEEIAYRATLPYIVADAISPNHDDALGMAVIISIVAFGLAHAYQGWRGILGTSLFAFEMHLIMFISGSLLICMCVHFLTDLSIGALYFNAVRKGQILAITATTAT